MRERLPYLEEQSPALHGPQLFGGEPVGKPLLHRLDGAQSRRLLIGPDAGRGRGSTSSRHEKRQQAKCLLSLAG